MKIDQPYLVSTIPEAEGAPPIQVLIGFSGMVIVEQSDFAILVDEPQVDQLISALQAAKEAEKARLA